MKALLQQVVFSVDGRDYLWEDVVRSAESRGDWARLRRRASEDIARLRKWEEEPEALEDAEIESAADEFRYDRDLISAEEMETWLARWGLTPESWMDYVRGSLLRRKWSGDPTGIAETASSEPEFEEHLLAEAVCSGELRRLAETLAGRAAIAARERERSDGASLEEIFRRFSDRLLTPDAIRAQIHASQTDWTSLDCRCVAFPNEEAAREAALGVRTDGRTLDEVARDANREARGERIYVEKTPPESRSFFLGARKGELIGPVPAGGEFLLYFVLDKVLPSEDDESVVRRAREAVVARVVEAEMNDRVTWRWQF